jgi:tetratricopeptide (TPR) repeat protein
MGGLATAYSGVSRHPDAIALRQQILENRKARLGPDHPETLAMVGHLAGAYQHAGQWDTSARLLEQLLEERLSLFGSTDPASLVTMHNLALNYAYVGRLAESLALHERVLELLKSANRSEPGAFAWPLHTYAVTCQRAGKFDQADRLFREALEHCRKRDDSFLARISTASTLGWLARNLLYQERYAEAEPIAREALAIFEKQRPEDPKRFYWMSVLGSVLCGQERYAEAEPLMLQGYEGMKQREALLDANWRSRLTDARERIVRFYMATNQPEKARAWRQKVKAN